jgi:hypothetical protein
MVYYFLTPMYQIIAEIRFFSFRLAFLLLLDLNLHRNYFGQSNHCLGKTLFRT